MTVPHTQMVGVDRHKCDKCNCVQFTPRDEAGKKCTCGHSRRHHTIAEPPPLPSHVAAGPALPPPATQTPVTVSSMLERVRSRNAAQASSSSGAGSSSNATTVGVARTEALVGYRPTYSTQVRATQKGTGRRSVAASVAFKGRSRKSSGDKSEQRIGEIILLPEGTERDKNNGVVLVNDAYPDKTYLASLRRHGLAVTEDLQGKPLQINSTWVVGDIDRYLRDIFPEPFHFLDHVCSLAPNEQHFQLLERDGRHLVPVQKRHDQPITGEDLIRAISGKRVGMRASRLHFVLHRAIPDGMCRDWALVNTHIENGTIEEYEASVLQEEDDADRSASGSIRGSPPATVYDKGKSKAQSTSTSDYSDQDATDSDDSDNEHRTGQQSIRRSTRLLSKRPRTPTPEQNHNKRRKTGSNAYVVPEVEDVSDDDNNIDEGIPYPLTQQAIHATHLLANATPVNSTDSIMAVAAASSPNTNPFVTPTSSPAAPVPKISGLPVPVQAKSNPWNILKQFESQ
ncbi:hypothetical protein OH76DRAFT_1484401 [Lentinus brumalis]|uniref:Uncharacterized protein n=1 Tax=Lentinus brumalis TaxID=2498619 RepID=A0A371D5A1_9APHY|nr:hypothetical protein OH76DRAFT_1484401 [Polyporus brumalis]